MKSWDAPEVPALPGNGPVPVIWDTPSGGLRAAAAGPDATLYACGITPYDATHIGHAATYLAWDLLVRAWRDAGMTVRYVQNVTDVDDPLLERAARDGEDWMQLAAREIARYRSDMAALRVVPPDHLVGAVEALPLITDFSLRLADRGALYDLDGDTYFARAADPLFGSVSGLDPATMAELSAERGGDPARAGKKDPLDPLVWRAERPGEPAWTSPFGRGRPGWHVECSAIATRYLGTAFDVQAGGSDLIFPHHEMSASQARIALAETGPAETGPGVAQPGGPARTVFARRYAHAGMVRLGGRKMSKSLGNLVFVSGLREAGTDPMAIRLAVLAHHYRQDWDWDDQVLAAAVQRLARWRAAIATAGGGKARAARSHGAPDRATAAVLGALRERLAADLDAPGALAVVDGWANAVLAQRPAPAPGGSGPPVSAVEAGLAQAAVVRAAVDALLGVAL